ncbi:MAG: hypothetical protein KGJ31_01435 [Patescibacteria group bacterium]|nr:hypothetical protein [Patescibacteria group bacterium]
MEIVKVALVVAAWVVFVFVFTSIIRIITDLRLRRDLLSEAAVTCYGIIEFFWSVPRRYYVRWRCRLAREYLLTHDLDFRAQEAGVELVRRREKFYAGGGKPDDPGCPEIFDVLDDWGYSPFRFRR